MARGQYRDQARGSSRSFGFGDLGFRALGSWSSALAALGLCLGVTAASLRDAHAQAAPATGFAAPGAFGAGPGAFPVTTGAYAPPPGAAATPAPVAPAAEAEAPPVPPAWLLTPSIELDETFTDNANLAPAGSRVWDFITSVSPALNLAGQTARLNVGLTYDPQELIFARSSPSHALQQRLLGTGTAILWPDALFFDASASIAQAFIRPTGAIGTTTLTTNNNLQTVYATSASPYLRQHLGAFADSETRYRFSTASTSGTGATGTATAPEQIHDFRETLVGGEAFGRLGWQLLGDYNRLERLQDPADPLGGTAGTDKLARADFRYPIYQALAAIGGAGYEKITDPTLSTQPKGPIWNVGLQYQPNQLVSTSLTYGERFNTTDIEFNATYNLDPQLRLSAAYTETIQTSLSQIAGNTSNLVLVTDPTTGAVTVAPATPGSAPGTPTLSAASFGVTSGAFLAKTAELDAVLTKERNTYSGRIFESKETGSSNSTVSTTLTGGGASGTGTTSASAVTAERIIGSSFTWGHQLWPDLTASTGATYYRALFLDGSGRRDNAYTLSIGLTYALSRNATSTITLSRSDLRSNIAADSLVVDTVMATIRKQF